MATYIVNKGAGEWTVQAERYEEEGTFLRFYGTDGQEVAAYKVDAVRSINRV